MDCPPQRSWMFVLSSSLAHLSCGIWGRYVSTCSNFRISTLLWSVPLFPRFWKPDNGTNESTWHCALPVPRACPWMPRRSGRKDAGPPWTWSSQLRALLVSLSGSLSADTKSNMHPHYTRSEKDCAPYASAHSAWRETSAWADHVQSSLTLLLKSEGSHEDSHRHSSPLYQDGNKDLDSLGQEE